MEPLLHFAIPFAFLTLMKVRLRKAFLLSLLALTPDLDALFHIHRSISHSAVTLSALIALIWLLDRRHWLRAQIPLASLALFSHLIFDLFAGYTPILWPLTQTSVWVQAELRAYLGSGLKFSLNLRLLKESTNFYRFQSLDAPLFTSQGFIASLALLTPIITAKIKEYIETRHIKLNITMKKKVSLMSQIFYFTFESLASFKRLGLRNGNWFKLGRLDKALFNCALALAKLRGKLRNMDLMIRLAKMILTLKATFKANLIKLGLAKAQALTRLYALKGVFEWAPSLKEWLKEPSYILYLGLREIFG